MRYIKPGIMTNEDLCELGPYAYILFTSLWMLADREGRLEDRPKRIKAEAMPLWDDVPWQTVDNLLEKLSEKGFIHRYKAQEHSYIQVTNWKKHQCPHPREGTSTIPVPASANGASADAPTASVVAMPRHVQGIAEALPSRVGNGEWVMGNRSGGVVEDRGCGGKEPASVENPPPPPNPKPTQPPAAAKRKPPSSERGAGQTPRKSPTREDRAREGPQELPRARAAPLEDFWPHKTEDVMLVRESLNQLAAQVHMPPPDDDIVRQVLDACRGASGEEIHGVLKALFHKNKFRNMYSWGFLPVVLGPCFHAA